MMEQNEFDIIEKYYLNELPQEEMERIRRRLAEDESFRREFEETRMVFEAIEKRGENELREEMKKWDQELGAGTTKNPRNKWYLAAAMIAILITFAVYIQQSIGSKDLYAEYYNPPSTPELSMRGEPTERALVLKSAYELFEEKKYKLASEKFSKYLTEVEDRQAKFFYAISLLEQNELEKALKEFLELTESADEDRYNWYLGLCYLKLERKDDAVKVFNGILGSEKYGDRVSEIIAEID